MEAQRGPAVAGQAINQLADLAVVAGDGLDADNDGLAAAAEQELRVAGNVEVERGPLEVHEVAHREAEARMLVPPPFRGDVRHLWIPVQRREVIDRPRRADMRGL